MVDDQQYHQVRHVPMTLARYSNNPAVVQLVEEYCARTGILAEDPEGDAMMAAKKRRTSCCMRAMMVCIALLVVGVVVFVLGHQL